MAFTMMATAGAAYTDQADIEATEAVDMLNALGIITGYDDGSFKPNGTVTRAEMATMIYIVRNGGNKDATAYANAPTSFTDITNHWAAGYIKFCQAAGIISGKSATIFDPDAAVTGVEASLMCLRAAGYDAEKAGIGGSTWATKTLALAAQKGITDDYSVSLSEGAPRQWAAQLIYNTLFTATVTWSKDAESFVDDVVYDYGNNGVVASISKVTVGSKYMGLKEATGTYEANDKFDGMDAGEIRVNVTNGDGLVNGQAEQQYATYDLGLEWIGEEVKVLYKESKDGVEGLDDKDTVYGVFNTGATKVYNITKGDLQDGDSDNGKIKFGDKSYTAADQIEVIQNYGAQNVDNATAKSFDKDGAYYGKYADTIKFIENNGKITTAYINTYTVARVTSVGTDDVSFNKSIGSIDFEGNDIYEGIAKDDIVAVQTFFGANPESDDAYSIVTKLDVASAELTGYKAASGNPAEMDALTFDESTYDVLETGLLATSIDSDFEQNLSDQIGETYDFYLLGGYVYAAKMTSDGVKNYALITGDTGEAGNKANPFKISIFCADGSERLVEVDNAVKESPEANEYVSSALKAGVVIKYSNINDSKIKVRDLGTSTKVNGTIYDKDTKKFNGTVTASDAPLFIKKANDDYAVYTIRNLDTIKVDASTDISSLTDDNKIVAGYIALGRTPSGASSDTVYGIVSDNAGSIKENGTDYTKFSIDVYDKEGAMTTVVAKVEGANVTAFDEGDMVAFDRTGDDTYSDTDFDVLVKDNVVKTASYDEVVAARAKEYDEKGQILTIWETIAKVGEKNYQGYNNETKVLAVDDDVVLSYVNAADNEGAAVGSLDEFDNTTGYTNIVYVVKDDKVVAIFVDKDANILEDTGEPDGVKSKDDLDAEAAKQEANAKITAAKTSLLTALGASDAEGTAASTPANVDVTATTTIAASKNTFTKTLTGVLNNGVQYTVTADNTVTGDNDTKTDCLQDMTLTASTGVLSVADFSDSRTCLAANDKVGLKITISMDKGTSESVYVLATAKDAN